MLFQGNPLGFSLFIFIIFLAVSVYFSIFLKKEFGKLSSLIFLILTAASPYLIQISFFAISSAPAAPLILVLLYLTYLHLKTSKDSLVLFIFLTLGFILETELPTGVFLIPGYFLTIFLTRNIKVYFGNLRKITYSALGLFMPISLRVISELKNDFLQTKAVFNLLQNSPGVKKTIIEIFLERTHLFWDYYLRIFSKNSFYLEYMLLTVTVVGILFVIIKSNSLLKKYVFFILIFLSSTFIASLFYKNIVWQNYLEGLSLFYILIIAISLGSLIKSSELIIKYIPVSLLSLLILFNLFIFTKDLNSFSINPDEISLREQINTVNYIYDNTPRGDFCTRVYTPPVIPYTYNYLFDYYSKKRALPVPKSIRYIDGSCWLILEKDTCKFGKIEKREKKECESRIVNWKKDSTPRAAQLVKRKVVNKKLSIELWNVN